MKATHTSQRLQLDERIVIAVAAAMCGHAMPCSYHVANARLAIAAYRQAQAIEVLSTPTSLFVGETFIEHKGIVR